MTPQVVKIQRCEKCGHPQRLDPDIDKCTVDGCNGSLAPDTISYKQYEEEVMNDK